LTRITNLIFGAERGRGPIFPSDEKSNQSQTNPSDCFMVSSAYSGVVGQGGNLVMEWILRALPSRPQPIWIRYGVTTLLVGLCFLLMKGVQEFSPIQAYFLLSRQSFWPQQLLATIVHELQQKYDLAPEK